MSYEQANLHIARRGVILAFGVFLFTEAFFLFF